MRSEITKGILIALFSASLGFGFSQVVIVGEVKTHTTEIGHLKQADVDIKKEVSEDRNRVDHKIEMIVDLFKKSHDQNMEFISLLKIQNEILLQQTRKNP